MRGRVRVAITNKAPLAVYRGVGHPVAILVMEALMDEAARRLDVDPADLGTLSASLSTIQSEIDQAADTISSTSALDC